MEPELTTLIAKPATWQRIQRWPSAFLLVLGLWSLVYGFEPAGLLAAVIGFWGTAEFWRGIHVTGDRLVAQGRIRRHTVPLAEFLQVGISPARTVWVQARGRRTLVLHMAESRTDVPGNVTDVWERLRELATAAGAELDPPLDDLVHAPRPSTPFFGW